jgi:hypothetical protein
VTKAMTDLEAPFLVTYNVNLCGETLPYSHQGYILGTVYLFDKKSSWESSFNEFQRQLFTNDARLETYFVLASVIV